MSVCAWVRSGVQGNGAAKCEGLATSWLHEDDIILPLWAKWKQSDQIQIHAPLSSSFLNSFLLTIYLYLFFFYWHGDNSPQRILQKSRYCFFLF